MHVTVCVCTCDRGDSITTTVCSILNATYADFDVVVVDQSASDETEQALRSAVGADPRVTYVRSATVGSGAAHNVAVAHARGDIVSFTDDCEVSPDRMRLFVEYFHANPDVGLIFGAVHAAPHDPRAGFVPDYPVPAFRRVASPWLKWRERGIDANMAFRVEALQAVGPFDEVLGPGAPLHACLDGDMTYRMLNAGYAVLNVPDAYVVHPGFRSSEQGQRMMRRVGLGVGAAYMKHLRSGDVAVLPTLFVEALRCVAWRRLATMHCRHLGVARFYSYLRGIMKSFDYGIDRRWRTYRHPRATELTPDAHVTVCICTRDRGPSIATTLRSLIASDYKNFDVVVVDQSTTGETARTVNDVDITIEDGQRFTYVRSHSVGLSAARNVALAHARGPVIAFTDDDCEIPPKWLRHIVQHFHHNPDVGEILGAVLAGPHDSHAGFIPDYPLSRRRRISSPWMKWREGGIGANMSFRLDVLHAVGPFDEVLGAGGPLHSCEDGDMTYRVLRAGYTVLNVPDTYVIHHGFRTWEQGKVLMHRTGVGVAAAYIKHARLGDPAVLPTLIVEWLRCISWPRLLRLRRHSGLGRFLSYARGMAISFRYAVDPAQRTYVTIAGWKANRQTAAREVANESPTEGARL